MCLVDNWRSLSSPVSSMNICCFHPFTVPLQRNNGLISSRLWTVSSHISTNVEHLMTSPGAETLKMLIEQSLHTRCQMAVTMATNWWAKNMRFLIQLHTIGHMLNIRILWRCRDSSSLFLSVTACCCRQSQCESEGNETENFKGGTGKHVTYTSLNSSKFVAGVNTSNRPITWRQKKKRQQWSEHVSET